MHEIHPTIPDSENYTPILDYRPLPVVTYSLDMHTIKEKHEQTLMALLEKYEHSTQNFTNKFHKHQENVTFTHDILQRALNTLYSKYDSRDKLMEKLAGHIHTLKAQVATEKQGTTNNTLNIAQIENTVQILTNLITDKLNHTFNLRMQIQNVTNTITALRRQQVWLGSFSKENTEAVRSNLTSYFKNRMGLYKTHVDRVLDVSSTAMDMLARSQRNQNEMMSQVLKLAAQHRQLTDDMVRTAQNNIAITNRSQHDHIFLELRIAQLFDYAEHVHNFTDRIHHQLQSHNADFYNFVNKTFIDNNEVMREEILSERRYTQRSLADTQNIIDIKLDSAIASIRKHYFQQIKNFQQKLTANANLYQAKLDTAISSLRKHFQNKIDHLQSLQNTNVDNFNSNKKSISNTQKDVYSLLSHLNSVVPNVQANKKALVQIGTLANHTLTANKDTSHKNTNVWDFLTGLTDVGKEAVKGGVQIVRSGISVKDSIIDGAVGLVSGVAGTAATLAGAKGAHTLLKRRRRRRRKRIRQRPSESITTSAPSKTNKADKNFPPTTKKPRKNKSTTSSSTSTKTTTQLPSSTKTTTSAKPTPSPKTTTTPSATTPKSKEIECDLSSLRVKRAARSVKTAQQNCTIEGIVVGLTLVFITNNNFIYLTKFESA